MGWGRYGGIFSLPFPPEYLHDLMFAKAFGGANSVSSASITLGWPCPSPRPPPVNQTCLIESIRLVSGADRNVPQAPFLPRKLPCLWLPLHRVPFSSSLLGGILGRKSYPQSFQGSHLIDSSIYPGAEGPIVLSYAQEIYHVLTSRPK